MTVTGLENHDVTSSEHKRDPYPFYARLRSEDRAIQVTFLGGIKVWLITRYEDVIATLEQDSLFPSDGKNAGLPPAKEPWWFPSQISTITRNMAYLDDPEHSRLLGFAASAFKRQRIIELKPRIREITSNLLDALAQAEQPDFLSDFAVPLPVMVMCEFLGLPANDWKNLYRWTHPLLGAGSRRGMLRAIPSLHFFSRYLEKCFENSRIRPDDGLITSLVQAHDSGGLSKPEFQAMIMLFITAGYESTASLISSGMLALLENREVMETLRDNPTLMKSAVEELLRFVSPVEMAIVRHAARETVLHGRNLKRGDLLLPVIASANRDERQFTNPDRLDIRRNPGATVSFGKGVHHCIGFHLAKLEAEIAFSLVLEKFPNITLGCAPQQLQWRATPYVRSLESLPVSLGEVRAHSDLASGGQGIADRYATI